MTAELIPAGPGSGSSNPVVARGTDPGPVQADVYQRLLKERIVFLGTQVDQTSANLICAQLLLLDAEDP